MCKWRPCTRKSSSIHEWSAQVKITRFELKAQSHNLACWSYLCQKKEKTNEEIFTKNKKTTSHWNWSMLLVYSFQTHTHTHHTPAHVQQNYILHFSVVSSILGIFSRLSRVSLVCGVPPKSACSEALLWPRLVIFVLHDPILIRFFLSFSVYYE